MDRIIFHVDVNSAFLSWSAVKRLEEDPTCLDLRTVPSAVGGDVETRHGIITAKSIPAKKYGIVTGEPVVKALAKCPNLIMVHSDWQVYKKYSQEFMEILHEYSDLVEKASVDEAYVDMTLLAQDMLEQEEKSGNHTFSIKLAAQVIADMLRNEVRDKLKFTVNVGISSNKLLAKMASDFKKPDRTHTLWPEEVPQKMWPLPIGDLFGCGKRSAERLNGIGIITIGDAAKADPMMLKSFMGDKGGAYLYRAAHGISESSVEPTRDDAKSYSNETTVSEDIIYENYIHDAPPIVRKLAESVSRRMKKDGVFGSTISVSVKTNDFKRHSRQKKIQTSTNDADVIFNHAQELLQSMLFEVNGIFDRGSGVRLIGVGASTLDRGEYRQLSLEDMLRAGSDHNEAPSLQADENAEKIKKRNEKLEAMMNKIKDKYGDDTIHKGI